MLLHISIRASRVLFLDLSLTFAHYHSGNWGVDLKAGSEYGYRLLFVVLVAGLFAVYFQVLASRLGCVTGLGELFFQDLHSCAPFRFRTISHAFLTTRISLFNNPILRGESLRGIPS